MPFILALSCSVECHPIPSEMQKELVVTQSCFNKSILAYCQAVITCGDTESVGHTEKLETNSRDLTWNSFTAANIRVGTVINTTAVHSVDGSEFLLAHDIVMDFGEGLGARQAQAILETKTFASPRDLLNLQVLAVTNLASEGSTEARTAVLSVGGQAVLQPSKTSGQRLHAGLSALTDTAATCMPTTLHHVLQGNFLHVFGWRGNHCVKLILQQNRPGLVLYEGHNKHHGDCCRQADSSDTTAVSSSTIPRFKLIHTMLV